MLYPARLRVMLQSHRSNLREPSMEPGQEAPELREIYAYLSYIMLLSQALEGLPSQAIFAFVIFPAKKPEIKEIAASSSLAEWDAFVDSEDERLRRNSFGQLLSKLQKENKLTPDIEQSLKDALKQRNYVAHNFFSDKLATLYSKEGQHGAILLLRRVGGLLQNAIDRFSPLVQAELDRYGYDAAYVEEYARNATKNATKNAADADSNTLSQSEQRQASHRGRDRG